MYAKNVISRTVTAVACRQVRCQQKHCATCYAPRATRRWGLQGRFPATKSNQPWPRGEESFANHNTPEGLTPLIQGK